MIASIGLTAEPTTADHQQSNARQDVSDLIRRTAVEPKSGSGPEGTELPA